MYNNHPLNLSKDLASDDPRLLLHALRWAIASFKSEAMSKTTDQLIDECNALLTEEARISWAKGKLVYKQDEGANE